MDAFAPARRTARHWRGEALRAIGGTGDGEALVRAALRLAGLTACPVGADDVSLCGAEAVLDRDSRAIFYKASVSDALARFEIAHELGHFWMDGDSEPCAPAGFDLLEEDASSYGTARIDGYGPRQRRECQANVFARTFLLPEEEARRLYLSGASAPEIATAMGLETPLVIEQLIRGTLLPPEPRETAIEAPEGELAATGLDDSQRAAAEIESGPLLLEAGPGTGKTRTLVARVAHLLATGVDPARILILTFSRKAAEELRERIAKASPEAATQLWAGTFHAFGLEILRRYGEHIGLDPNLQPFDPNEAIALLETLLPTLPLDHYLALYDPAQALGDILGAISRAKDELVTPAGYQALGDAMPQHDSEQQRARSKVLEIAAVYACYQQALAAQGTCDFGDLIMRSCELLDAAPAVRDALRAEHTHILVDEFQDVNRASAILLRHLAGDGAGLWVVADARQSIYRFRGASPESVTTFTQDYPGASRLALGVNYRSSPQIVDAFAAFGSIMQAGGGRPCRWDAASPPDQRLDYDVADTHDAEADGLAAAIRADRLAGILFRDQAILCRSHTMLARFALALEAREIPVLYLGNVFERPEIRDLLSFLSLVGETGTSGLVRIGRLPRYAIPFDDLRALFARARETRQSQAEIIVRADGVELSCTGQAGLAVLRDDIAAVSREPSAHRVLLAHLFADGLLSRALVGNTSVGGAQQRLAIYQLLRAAASYAERRPDGGVKGFLDWIRRLELIGEERQLRTPPAAASAIDAVRLMTVHASKGLEFEAIHLPALATSHFPSSARYDPCPPPPGLVARAGDAVRLEEEECLFFVALSRAKRRLHLSRAQNYGVNRKPSSFLAGLAGHLPRAPDAAPTWRNPNTPTPVAAAIAACATRRETHDAEDLDQFLRCPRSYLYQRLLWLNGGRADSGYVRFHRAVYAVLRAFPGFRDLTDPLGAAATALEEAWARIGPVGHPYEALYRRHADILLDRALAAYLHIDGDQPDWTLPAGSSAIRIRPEIAMMTPTGLGLRRIRTGRAPKASPDDDLYALYHAGAAQFGEGAQVEAHYLGCDTIVPVAMSPRVIENRLAKYRQAIDDIAQGLFPTVVSDRVCPRCPQYFVCSGEAF